jgi:hypothetical protein
LVAVVKPEPLIVITLPGWPYEGEKPLMVAAAAIRQNSGNSIAAAIRRESQTILGLPVAK